MATTFAATVLAVPPRRARINQRAREVPLAELISLDAGRRDGLGAQEEWTDRLQARDAVSLIQLADGLGGALERLGGLEADFGIQVHDGIRHERFIGERGPGPPTSSGTGVSRPPSRYTAGHELIRSHAATELNT